MSIQLKYANTKINGRLNTPASRRALRRSLNRSIHRSLPDSRRAGAAHRRGGRAQELFGGCSLAPRGASDASQQRGGVAVQDLRARFVANLRFGQRLLGPVDAER